MLQQEGLGSDDTWNLLESTERECRRVPVDRPRTGGNTRQGGNVSLQTNGAGLDVRPPSCPGEDQGVEAQKAGGHGGAGDSGEGVLPAGSSGLPAWASSDPKRLQAAVAVCPQPLPLAPPSSNGTSG